MALTIEYRTERSEVIRWYWIKWRKQLWKYHILIFIGATAFTAKLIEQSGPPFSVHTLMKAASFGLACIIWLFLHPIVNHKRGLRTLSVDDLGIKTYIGKISGEFRWSEVGSIDVSKDEVIISGKNHNAFIIPNRAFENEEKRNEFISRLSGLHQGRH